MRLDRNKQKYFFSYNFMICSAITMQSFWTKKIKLNKKKENVQSIENNFGIHDPFAAIFFTIFHY